MARATQSISEVERLDAFGDNVVPVFSGVAYEEQLNRDSRWALTEGSRYFEETSKVHLALAKVTARLAELGIPYVVVGGLALFKHGYRRFTEDVDLLVTPEGLKRVHEQLEGLGYLPPFAGSKHLRDTELGVKVEFLVTGNFPGDGKPKAVAFPDPADVGVEIDGVKCIKLSKLIELKLASGMTNANRLKDLGDVQELIGFLNLPRELGEELDPFVRGKYEEFWQSGRKRFITVWRNEKLTGEEKTMAEVMARLPEAAGELAAMGRDGVMLEAGGAGVGFVTLVTIEPGVATKYDMHEREA